jgi:hypothetical protein
MRLVGASLAALQQKQQQQQHAHVTLWGVAARHALRALG